VKFNVVLWVAQGFGIGRIPFAPGTFGSLLGLGWFGALLLAGNFWLYLAGTVFGIALSVCLGGAAERVLRQPDPPSVVVDEIAAMPVCFLAWVASDWLRKGQFPKPGQFFSAQNWHLILIIFVLFRLFDILKPWPVRQSQSLPAGCGITVDDLLAALYVAAATLVVFH
jgi:phosphatidylglycerophosphatase A